MILKGMGEFDAGNKLTTIRCPVLAIGDYLDDVLGAEATLQIADVLKDKPDFEVYMYSSYGHAAYDIAPCYTQRLFDFFNN